MVLHRPDTPPMGWNSWDCYGTTVTEQEVMDNARFLAEHLAAHGWDTVVVDIDWADPTARAHGYNAHAPLALDDWGRLVPDPGRFPSAADGAGFGPLAERIHTLGMRFGIHTMRGIPRLAVERNTPVLGTIATATDIADPSNVCEWNPDMYGLNHDHPASRAYYDSTIALYASWGVDFLKTDDMLWPYQAREIEAYSGAIADSPRDLTLSLSPGRDLSHAHLEHLQAHASMWRVSDDLWDDWDAIVDNAARLARWAPSARAGAWPDGDMLPLGRIGIRAERGAPRDDALTPDERRALLTLWIMARSPLMFGGDLPSSAPETVALLTSPAIAVLRDSTGGREVRREDGVSVWTARGSRGARYAGVVNLADTARSLVLDVADLGLDGCMSVTELWSGSRLRCEPVATQSNDARGVAPGSAALRLTLPAHGAALVRAGTADQ